MVCQQSAIVASEAKETPPGGVSMPSDKKLDFVNSSFCSKLSLKAAPSNDCSTVHHQSSNDTPQKGVLTGSKSGLESVSSSSLSAKPQQDVVSLSHVLSPEILCQIFLVCLADATFRSPQHDGDESVHERTRTLLAITGVCKYWRDAAIACKLIWAKFLSFVHPDLARLMFERSGSSPLSLKFRSSDGERERKFEHVLRDILSQTDRIVEVDVTLQESNVMFPLILRSIARKAPNLRSLALADHTWDKIGRGLTFYFTLGGAPRLTHLRLDCIRHLQWHRIPLPITLKSLVLKKRIMSRCGEIKQRIDWMTLKRKLARLQHLEILELQDMMPRSDDEDVDSDTSVDDSDEEDNGTAQNEPSRAVAPDELQVAFPVLKTLTLRDRPVLLTKFLQSMHLPELTTLNLLCRSTFNNDQLFYTSADLPQLLKSVKMAWRDDIGRQSAHEVVTMTVNERISGMSGCSDFQNGNKIEMLFHGPPNFEEDATKDIVSPTLNRLTIHYLDIWFRPMNPVLSFIAENFDLRPLRHLNLKGGSARTVLMQSRREDVLNGAPNLQELTVDMASTNDLFSCMKEFSGDWLPALRKITLRDCEFDGRVSECIDALRRRLVGQEIRSLQVFGRHGFCDEDAQTLKKEFPELDFVWDGSSVGRPKARAGGDNTKFWPDPYDLFCYWGR